MNYNSKVVDIVAHIYESIAYDDVWQDVLHNISDILGAHSGELIFSDRKTHQLSLISTRLSEEDQERYIEDYSAMDERRIAYESAPVGAIRKGSELLDKHEFKQSKIYTYFLSSHEYFHSIGSCFYRDSQYIACIYFHRSELEDDFDNSSKKILGVFTPHLARAFTISLQTKLAQLQMQVQGQIKRTPDTALFLIQDKNIATPMNTKAEKLVESASVLTINHDRLTFKNQPTNKRLQQLIKQCILSAQGKDLFPGGFIRLESIETDAQEWHIGVTPYRSASHNENLWKAKGALVIVRAVEKDSFEKLNIVLSDFYGLTAAETQVLTKMISGLSGTEIAEELQLTKECVRSRLKKIYQKTGASNQVQLTHNILEGPYKLANMLGK